MQWQTKCDHGCRKSALTPNIYEYKKRNMSTKITNKNPFFHLWFLSFFPLLFISARFNDCTIRLKKTRRRKCRGENINV